MGNIAIVIGDDALLVERAVKRLSGGAPGLEIVDSILSDNEKSQLEDLKAVEDSFFTLPMFEPVKTTWWKNARFLPGGASKETANSVRKALDRFAEKLSGYVPADGQRLAISAPSLLKTSVFAKKLSKAAVFEWIKTPKGDGNNAAVTALVRDLAVKAGVSFASDGALEAFAAKVGGDAGSIVNELEKIRTYAGEGARPDEKDVAAVTSPGAGIETPPWDLTGAVASRNAPEALRAAFALSDRLGSGFAVVAATALEKQMRQLAVLCAMERAKPGSGSSLLAGWQYRENLAWLPKWTLSGLRLARSRFLELRERAVTSSGEGTDALVIAEIARCSGGGRRGGG